MRNSLTRTLMGHGRGSSYNGPEISLEEEVVVAADNAADIAEADNAMDVAEGLYDKAEALEDHADFMEEQVENATPTEMALSEQVIGGNLEGTGADVEEAAPALESYIGSRPSMEGIREMVRNFWEAIKRAVKKVWEKIKSYWRKFTSRVGSLEKSAKELRDRASKMSGKSVKNEDKKVNFAGSTLALVSTGTTAEKSAANIISNLELISKLNKKIATKYQPLITKGCEDISAALDKFDTESPVTSLKEVNSAADRMCTSMSTALTGDFKKEGDKRFNVDNGDTYQSAQLPGYKTLFQISPKFGSVTGEMEVARTLQSCDMFLAATSDKDFTVDDAELNVFEVNQCTKVADIIIDMCVELRYYDTGKGWKEMEKKQDKMNRAGDRIAKSADRLENSDENKSDARSAIYAAHRYVACCARWSKNPTMSLSNHTAAVARAAIAIANRSLSQYR